LKLIPPSLQIRCLRDELRAVGAVDNRQTGFDIERQPLLAVVELRFAAQRR
jgi:chromosome condensin MukBEF MukE localization factor